MLSVPYSTQRSPPSQLLSHPALMLQSPSSPRWPGTSRAGLLWPALAVRRLFVDSMLQCAEKFRYNLDHLGMNGRPLIRVGGSRAVARSQGSPGPAPSPSPSQSQVRAGGSQDEKDQVFVWGAFLPTHPQTTPSVKAEDSINLPQGSHG